MKELLNSMQEERLLHGVRKLEKDLKDLIIKNFHENQQNRIDKSHKLFQFPVSTLRIKKDVSFLYMQIAFVCLEKVVTRVFLNESLSLKVNFSEIFCSKGKVHNINNNSD